MNTCVFITSLVLILLIAEISCLAQTLPVQTIRGIVLDKDTRQPLVGATVAVADLDAAPGTVTETDGSFLLENVPVGRRSLEASYVGYASWRAEGLVLSEAHELSLEIELKEQAAVLDEVVVKAVSIPHQPQNDAAVLSARSFSVEETQHFAGAINDPGRMAHSLPGVQPSKDNEGDIIIRGNASGGLLWRLEGVDILNPNHFARLGGSGGGLTIFSVSVLGASDFFTGAFPAEYGNALAGVFDVRFRNGNRERRQHTFRAGMLGLEVATEGPFQKKKHLESDDAGSSYLLNYRYSTLGILNALGIQLVGERVSNNFQDLSFNLFFPGKKQTSTWRVWGAGGLSLEKKTAAALADWQVFEDSTNYRTGSDVGILGVTHLHSTGARSHLKISAAAMAQRAFYNFRRQFGDGRAEQIIQDENYVQGKAALSAFFTQKMSARTTLQTGLQISSLHYDLRFDTAQAGGGLFSYLDEKGSTWQAQPFAQISFQFNAKWTLHGGLHGFWFGLTKDLSIEPRLSVRRSIGEGRSLSFAAGLHRQAVPLGVYFIRLPDNNSNQILQPNRHLNLMKSLHLALAGDFLFAKQWRLHVEAYAQDLSDIPADYEGDRSFWLLNTIEGFPARRLRNEGEGLNAGIDFSLEKFFRRGFFFLVNASVFESIFYKGFQHFNTQFNARYSTALTMGREWSLPGGGVLQAGMKNLYVGGLPATPLADVQPSGERPLLDETRPFSERIPAYWRTDLRLAWRKGRVSLSLDVQNLFNRKNKRAFSYEFDEETSGWQRRNQAELTPVLGFQVDL